MITFASDSFYKMDTELSTLPPKIGSPFVVKASRNSSIQLGLFLVNKRSKMCLGMLFSNILLLNFAEIDFFFVFRPGSALIALLINKQR